MSKKQKKNVKRFKYTASATLPKLGSIKETWDLKKHFYTNAKDPRIESDIQSLEKEYQSFVKKFKGTDFTSSNTLLKKALDAYMKLLESRGGNPLFYFFYRLALNAQDTEAEKLSNLLSERLTKLGITTLFFELAITKLPEVRQQEILEDSSLTFYHQYIKRLFAAASHTLTEAEERIMSLKSQTSNSMWVSGTEKIVGAKMITYKGKEMPLNAALMQFMDLPKKDRAVMWDACAKALETIGPVAENELTAIITDKKINDELRGYTKPYSATTQSYDQTDSNLETLISVVTEYGFPLSKKFYAHKASLEKGKLSYIDRDDYGAKLPEVSFETAVTVCRDAFYGFNPQYGQYFDVMLNGGQLDVYPKKGKGGGAFCSSSSHTKTYVLLNQTNDFQSLRTLAHEMGHAIHAERSRTQHPLYDDHSIVTAETASTFFEAVVGDRLLAVLPKKEKIALLNNLICDKIGTIMMCVARFNAELEIHERVRKEGAMTWQEMSNCLLSHFKSYCGPKVAFRGDEGHLVVSKVHYRMNFYQYSYSFGSLASSIMFNRYKKDPSYAKQVDAFLTAGRSANVQDIFASIGIELNKKEVLLEGIELLAEEIRQFIELTKA